jgi:hypothetical protein
MQQLLPKGAKEKVFDFSCARLYAILRIRSRFLLSSYNDIVGVKFAGDEKGLKRFQARSDYHFYLLQPRPPYLVSTTAIGNENSSVTADVLIRSYMRNKTFGIMIKFRGPCSGKILAGIP